MEGDAKNGYLHVILTKVAYLTPQTNIFFDPSPIHPGKAPTHAAENICLCNQEIDDLLLYKLTKSVLKQQILQAVESRYLQFLGDLLTFVSQMCR